MTVTLATCEGRVVKHECPEGVERIRIPLTTIKEYTMTERGPVPHPFVETFERRTILHRDEHKQLTLFAYWQSQGVV